MSPEITDEQSSKEIVECAEDNMWIVEGQIDLPIILPQIEGKLPTSGICLDFSGGTGDGYIELWSADPARTQQSVWWSRNEPILFDFRASVIGHGLLNGWQRAMNFLDQALDRLSFLSGVPASLASVSILYNETQLEACRRGERTYVDCAPGGISTQNTLPIQNPHLVPNLQPSERCKRALRWFRKGLASENPDDRFLAFYMALECVSDDVEETKQKTLTCRMCKQDTGIQKAHTDGFKRVIARRRELPRNTFKVLGKARAKLVHEGKSVAACVLPSRERPDQTFSLLSILEQLAAEAIAISLKSDPEMVRVIDTQVPNMTVVGQFEYTTNGDPGRRWQKSVRAALADIETVRIRSPKI